MHIVIAALTVIGVVAVWIWRARAAAQASRDIVEAADDVRAVIRRHGFQRKSGRHPAETVEDPRLAAAGMMAAMARLDGALTEKQINALRVECRASFRVSQVEADEIAAYGRWLADQSKDPDDSLRRLGRVLRAIAPREAQEDMIAMLTRVASAEGGAPSDVQAAAIERVRRGFQIA